MTDVKTTGILKTALPNESVKEAVDNYLERFAGTFPAEQRLLDAAQVNRKFYSLVTDFYLHGWGRMFHFGVMQKGDNLRDALMRHEYYLADKLQLHDGECCLDIGSGVAGPMMNLSRRYNARITGINNCTYQVNKARQFIVQERLAATCTVMECDWMHIPLEGESFDKAYTIEAACHAAEKRAALFKEVERLLKPGALFAGYDWVMTANYNPRDATHRAIKRDIEISNGISNLGYASDIITALQQSGFKVLECTDCAVACDPETPWYHPLKGKGFSLAMLRRSPAGRFIMRHLFSALEKCRILPEGTLQVSRLLNKAGEALVAGGELHIFTPMQLFVAKKVN